MNHVLLFGGTGSVRGYGRTSDFLMHISRVFLASATFHYVDDFFGLERGDTAESAFSGFAELNLLIGCAMKKSKEAPPADTQKVLGVLLDVSSEEVVVSPTEDRRRKLSAFAKNILLQHTLSPTTAGSFVGKAMFFDSSTVGHVGRAAAKPLYVRQHSPTHTITLTPSLVAAVRTFNALAVCAQARTLPLSTRWRPVPLLYADAFFRLGNDQLIPDDIRLNKVAVDWRQTGHLQNGFGSVLFPIQGPPQFFHGHVPAEALRRFASRDAFIFSLEAVVQMVSL